MSCEDELAVVRTYGERSLWAPGDLLEHVDELCEWVQRTRFVEVQREVMRVLCNVVYDCGSGLWQRNELFKHAVLWTINTSNDFDTLVAACAAAYHSNPTDKYGCKPRRDVFEHVLGLLLDSPQRQLQELEALLHLCLTFDVKLAPYTERQVLDELHKALDNEGSEHRTWVLAHGSRLLRWTHMQQTRLLAEKMLADDDLNVKDEACNLLTNCPYPSVAVTLLTGAACGANTQLLKLLLKCLCDLFEEHASAKLEYFPVIDLMFHPDALIAKTAKLLFKVHRRTCYLPEANIAGAMADITTDWTNISDYIVASRGFVTPPKNTTIDYTVLLRVFWDLYRTQRIEIARSTYFTGVDTHGYALAYLRRATARLYVIAVEYNKRTQRRHSRWNTFVKCLLPLTRELQLLACTHHTLCPVLPMAQDFPQPAARR